ncbi:VanZ family protein [Nocardioidaceae bacterium]|nr:VanZ family protein [Nocardioidaceae bacterium]
MRGGRGVRRRGVAAAGVLLAALLIAAMVATPTPDLPGRAITGLSRAFTLVPGIGGGPRTYAAVEVGLNVLLFVPLGLALAVLRPARGALWATGVCFWVTVAVETGQGALLPDRSAQASDVVANTLGGAVAYAAAALVVRRRSASRAREREIAADMGRTTP